MLSFKDFLASQESRIRAEQSALAQAKESWIAAVRTLLAQIKDWVNEADPDHLVRLDYNLVGDIDELGNMREIDGLERLTIWLGSQQVKIRPASREVLVGPRWRHGEGRWSGRVDMLGDPYGYEFYLFTHADGRVEWHIRSTRDYQMKPLDRLSFDAAMVELFS